MKLAKVDCSRGAPMGRVEKHITNAGPVKMHLEQVDVSSGYDSGGAYWGIRPIGITLYRYWWNGNRPNAQGPVIIEGFIDARNRDEAKQVVLSHYTEATFYQ